jgi:hypothetical protein
MTRQDKSVPLKYKVTADGLVARVSEPLIYTAIYGSDIYYECLGLWLRSIHEIGGYDGRIAVFADRSADEIFQYAPASLRPQIVCYPLNERGYLSRYTALDARLSDYAPIIYLDTDIIIDRPLAPLITRIARQPGVCVTTETERYGELAAKSAADVTDENRIGNWWGLELLRSDPDCASRPCPLVNSGIIGFDSYESYAQVSALMEGLFNHPRHEHLVKYFTDQPLLNYILVKTELGAYETLKGICSFASGDPPRQARGVTHFVWARGAEKRDAMQRYLAQLLDTAGSIDA